MKEGLAAVAETGIPFAKVAAIEVALYPQAIEKRKIILRETCTSCGKDLSIGGCIENVRHTGQTFEGVYKIKFRSFI